MSESIAPAIIEGARIFASVKREQARYDYLSGGRETRDATPKAAETIIPGIELKNYVNRSQTEDETHILVVDHKEYLEKIPEPPVPPTPEEIAQAREDKKFLAKLWAGVAAVGVVVAGVVITIERGRKYASTQTSAHMTEDD